MPTYDYQCRKCGHRFELFQSMSDEPKKRCPECRGRVERLISGRGRDPFQRVRLLRDGLPQRKLQIGGEGGQAQRIEKQRLQERRFQGRRQQRDRIEQGFLVRFGDLEGRENVLGLLTRGGHTAY